MPAALDSKRCLFSQELKASRESLGDLTARSKAPGQGSNPRPTRPLDHRAGAEALDNGPRIHPFTHSWEVAAKQVSSPIESRTQCPRTQSNDMHVATGEESSYQYHQENENILKMLHQSYIYI